MKMPFNGKFEMTQPYGVMYKYKGKRLKHKGTDWALPKNTPVVACFDGVVIRIEKWRSYGYGRSVYIRDKTGTHEALYAHLSTINVEMNQVVNEGQLLGHSGRTGFSRGKTGYHLHFGLKKGGYYVDSLLYLKDNNQLEFKLDEKKVTKEKKKASKKKKAKIEYITKSYIVSRGDTLWSISEQFYGMGRLWEKIFIANSKIIGNPNKIYPGQILKIPGFK